MAYWAYSGIPKYEKYMDYLINRLVLGYFLELLEMLDTPGEELARCCSIPEERADPMAWLCVMASGTSLWPCHSHSCKEPGD